jgi:signal peptidase I
MSNEENKKSIHPSPITNTQSLNETKKKTLKQKLIKIITVYVPMALLLVFAFGFFFFFPVKVPTGAMLNTVLIGDHLLISRRVNDLKRGDVVVFRYPKDPSISYIKRIIGLPGETILIRSPKVFINGQELPEKHLLVSSSFDDYAASLSVMETKQSPLQATYQVYYLEYETNEEELLENALMGQKFAVNEPFQIPQDQYFVMGDNRDNSQDSRYWGTVPKDYIIGRAGFVYYSFDISKDSSGNTSSGNFIVDLFTRTRWNRLGTSIK